MEFSATDLLTALIVLPGWGEVKETRNFWIRYPDGRRWRSWLKDKEFTSVTALRSSPISHLSRRKCY